MSITDKKARVEHANQLIKAIASHGRKFFLSSKGDVAEFEIDVHGKVWYRDDYSRALIPMGVHCRWKGFTHGGTLRDLVERMWAYIESGLTIDRACIGYERADGSNIWGYKPADIEACRRQCYALPIIDPEAVAAA